MKLTRITAAMVVLLAVTPLLAQPTQSNNTGPTTTGEPAATTTNPNGAVTGAALIPNSAVRTPDVGTRVGAGTTGIGLYSDKLVRAGDVLTTRTAANPDNQAVIENPGVRAGTLPRIKPDNTQSQTNLGAENTGKLNVHTQTEGATNRPSVSQPGSGGTTSGGSR